MSCVVSVVGICASDDGLKISPSQNAQTPPNDKHDGYGDPCLILKFLIRFNTTALLPPRRFMKHGPGMAGDGWEKTDHDL